MKDQTLKGEHHREPFLDIQTDFNRMIQGYLKSKKDFLINNYQKTIGLHAQKFKGVG